LAQKNLTRSGSTAILARSEDKPIEHCGIVGIKSYSGHNVARLTLEAMMALQHRGQESFGIAVGKNRPKTMKGLVRQGLERNSSMERLRGTSAIGHLRYATVGSGNDIGNFHPIQINHAMPFRIAHNGTMSTVELEDELKKKGVKLPTNRTDTELSGYLLAELHKETGDWVETFRQFSKIKNGSFCFTIQLQNGDIIAAKDERGYMPLSYGHHAPTNSFVVVSEDHALNMIDAKKIAEIPAGHILMLGAKAPPKLYSFQTSENLLKAIDPFQLSYFANPDSTLWGDFKVKQTNCSGNLGAPENYNGIQVALGRQKLGEALFDKFGALGNLVLPAPSTGNAAAEGYSYKSGIQLSISALFKDRYAGKREFIRSEAERIRSSQKKKIIAIKALLEGKEIVLVDDSIVRGESTAKFVNILRKADVKKISILSTFPPIQFPCHMGIAFPTQEELIAFRLNKGGNIEEVGPKVAKHLGIDFVGYLDPVVYSKITGIKLEDFCFACVTGDFGKLRHPPENLVRIAGT